MKICMLSCFTFIVLAGVCKQVSAGSNISSKDFSTHVIYGKDDRIEFYEIPNNAWRAKASATVIVVNNRRVKKLIGRDEFELDIEHYGKSFGLCEDEPFYEQYFLGTCSGFLIAPDLIVTAGHCVRNQNQCENVHFIFDYAYNSVNQDLTTISKDKVYTCGELLHSVTNALTGVDMAIIRLNREVEDRNPLQVRTQGAVTLDDPLTVIGYPKGIPGKMAKGGLIRDVSHDNFFVTTLDTYGGNSGSAVFNSETGLVEGILVRGDNDFVYDQQNKCRRSNICSESECRGEDVVRISHVLNQLDGSLLNPAQ